MIARGIRTLAAACASIGLLFAAPQAGAAVTPLSQYGSLGSGAGQIDAPLDVAIDPATADVYVADGNNRRIDVFAADGNFKLAFGKDVDPGGGTGPEVCTTACQAGDSGTGPGELGDVEGVEVSEAGEVFVADYGLQRISVYDTQGQFLRAFGKNVVPGGGTGFEVCTTSCQSGEVGGGPGELNNPWGMTTGPDGSLYVTDVDNHRINVYRPSGEFVRAFGRDVVPGGGDGFETCTQSCQAGLANGSPGSLDRPEGVDLDPAGNLWIAEYSGNRISVVGVQGEPVFLRAFGNNVIPGGDDGFEVCTQSCQTGDADPQAGALSSPQGVAVDLLGGAYVADSGNQRIVTFSSTPDFLGAFGDDVVPGAPGGFEICTTDCQSGTESDVPGGFSEPYEPADDCRGAVYVTDVGNNRIQRLGEPGTPLGPCRFAIGAATRNKRKGTAKLPVEVPAPGTLTIGGKGVKPAAVEHVTLAGTEILPVKAKGKAKRKLKKKGKRVVRPVITFAPSAFGETTEDEQTQLKLKRKRKRR